MQRESSYLKVKLIAIYHRYSFKLELISKDVEFYTFPSPMSFGRHHDEDSEYGSETASVYDEENQIECEKYLCLDNIIGSFISFPTR